MVAVLVTGGAGFIGGNLCRRLLHDGADIVRVLDDLSSGAKKNLEGLPVEFIEGSILDRDLLDQAIGGCSNVVHLAAVPSVPRSIADPMRSHEANATGTLRVLEAARAHPRVHVTLASSSSVYGANPALPKTEDLQCRPMSPYAVSKLATEQYAMAYAACYGLRVLPFRFFNVYGPLQAAGHAYAAVIPAFLDAVVRGVPIPLHGDGSQTRDFTYVDTVTAVLAEAVASGLTSSPVNLAFGSRTSLNELIRIIEGVHGRPTKVERLPSRAGDMAHSQADDSRLRELFPGVAPTPLEAGIRTTLDWLRSRSSDAASSCATAGGPASRGAGSADVADNG